MIALYDESASAVGGLADRSVAVRLVWRHVGSLYAWVIECLSTTENFSGTRTSDFRSLISDL
jgi:hypothetical protein